MDQVLGSRPGQRDVGLALAHVADARRVESRRHVCTEKPVEQLQQFQQVDRAAVGGVVSGNGVKEMVSGTIILGFLAGTASGAED